MTLSIIIASWNTRELLAQCLHSILETSAVKPSALQPKSLLLEGCGVETIVVDNASTDGSPEMVQDSFPWVTLIRNQENYGFARANNQALEVARGRYFLFLNSDTRLAPGATAAMVDFLERNPQAGMAGLRLVFPDGRRQFAYGRFPSLWNEFLGLVGLHRWDLAGWDDPAAQATAHATAQAEPMEVDWLSGACLMVRRECLQATGPWDEGFFFFSEEVDLCCRAHKMGWQVVLVPGGPVIHVKAGSMGRSPERILRLYRGKLQYFRKHHLHWRALLGLMKTIVWLKLAVYSLLSIFRRGQRPTADLWRQVFAGLGEYAGLGGSGGGS